MKKIIFLIVTALCLNAMSFGNMEAKTDLEVLSKFDIDGTFLMDDFFIDAKKHFLEDMRKQYIYEKFAEGSDIIPVLKSMLNKEGIPPEFLYMALAESGFSLKAKSHKGATGIWQFIPSTAKAYGLKINDFVDERKDPIKSTKAAMAYLKTLHSIFGKWYLVAIAYNCGDGALGRAISKAGTDDLAVLTDPDKKYIPRESRNYVRHILSLAMLFNNVDKTYQDDVIHLLNSGAGESLVEFEVKGGTRLKDIAKSSGIAYEELVAYNRHLKLDYIPSYVKSYPIYIPYPMYAKFKDGFDEKKLDNKRASDYVVHIVKRGETLHGIGKRYGVSHSVIKDANNLSKNNLSLNQKLIIPKPSGHVKG